MDPSVAQRDLISRDVVLEAAVKISFKTLTQLCLIVYIHKYSSTPRFAEDPLEESRGPPGVPGPHF